MHKEIIISFIVIVCILGLNKVTQDNTDQTVEQMNLHLENVKRIVEKEDINYKEAVKAATETFEKWEEFDDILAFYIEHNEIEKVKTALTSMKSFIEVGEYTQSIESMDRCIYILEHIDEREKVTLDNIF